MSERHLCLLLLVDIANHMVNVVNSFYITTGWSTYNTKCEVGDGLISGAVTLRQMGIKGATNSLTDATQKLST